MIRLRIPKTINPLIPKVGNVPKLNKFKALPRLVKRPTVIKPQTFNRF